MTLFEGSSNLFFCISRLKLNLTEGVGFEPTRVYKDPTGFRDRRLRPLGHPSELIITVCCIILIVLHIFIATEIATVTSEKLMSSGIKKVCLNLPETTKIENPTFSH